MVSLVPEPEEAAAAAGSTSSDTVPGTADTPSDQQIQKLQQQINRQFAIDDYKGAVSVCEELCALISAKYDELHDECAGPYFQYATALLELAREENQVLGASKLEQGEEEEEEGPDSTGQPDAAGPSEGGDAGEENEGEEGEDGSEEDVSSLQIAWEVLELSRIIYSRQESPESRRKLAKVGIKLGEICMENEKLDEALIHFSVAIDDFIQCGEAPDSREISSTYYMMGLAASLDQKYEVAIEHFLKCSELMASQIAKTEGPEKDSLMEMKSEVDKMVSDCKDSLKQLEQYRKLVPSQSAGTCDSSSSSAVPRPPASASTSSSSAFPTATSSSPAFPNATSSSSAFANATSSSSAFANATSSSPAFPNAASSSPVFPNATSSSPAFPNATSSSPAFPNATSSSSAFPNATSSSAPVSNISHLVRKRPVSQPVQPTSHAAPSSTSEISAKLSVKPTVRVSPIVSSSTSPGSPQADRQTNGVYSRTRPATTSSSAITSSNSAVISSAAAVPSTAVVQSNEAQSTVTPAHAVRPTSSVNNQTNGVSSTTTSALEARLGGSTRGFEARLVGSSTSGFEARVAGSTSGIEGRVSGSSRQVATVSSVQRTEEAISSSSDFKRPLEDVEDMASNEAKRSKQ